MAFLSVSKTFVAFGHGADPLSSILILGGARSGKSRFAEQLAGETQLTCVYLATARAEDDEMHERIYQHRQQRGSSWHTVEEPLAIADALRNEARPGRVILVDCLTLWLSNLMIAGANVGGESSRLAGAVSKLPVPVIFVSSEVGQGIVPIDAMAREFRDHAGRLHQLMAKACEEVWFVTAGLPQRLK